MPYTRFRSFDPSFLLKRSDDGKPDEIDRALRLVASSDEPVRMGDWSEILEHDGANVDAGAARALLINHKSGWLAGPIRNITFNGRTCELDAEILPDARMESGVSVEDAVKSGALRGVSIGYDYRTEDTEWDNTTRTLRVKRWSLREVSLTPIPADSTAQVRSLPEGVLPPSRNVPMPDPVKPDQVDAAQVREAVVSEAREIAALAESLNLRAADYVGKPKADAQADMLRAVAKRDAERKPEPIAPATPGVRVGTEDIEKQRDCAVDAICARAGFKSKLDGNPYLGRSMLDQARLYARRQGIRGCEDWSRKDLANFALGYHDQISGIRDASGGGNISNASFASFVTLNAITKAVAQGFEMSSSTVKYQPLVATQRVPDFKSFYVGGLGTGNLQETAENTAFPELNKAEGAYNDQVKMWGGTLSLSLQALMNDDTSSFDRSLRSAGVIAQKTIDRRVFQKLLMGTSSSTGTSTWTGNTTSGCTPVFTTADTLAAARANLGKAQAALMAKTGLDGNPTGNMARFFVAGPTAGQYIAALTQQVGGQQVGNGNGTFPELIVSPWLEASALTGYSTTSYYAISDPAEVTTLLLSLISGYEAPQVWEYDAGSVGARKWKIWMPFEADLFYATAGGASVIYGAQQATT